MLAGIGPFGMTELLVIAVLILILIAAAAGTVFLILYFVNRQK